MATLLNRSLHMRARMSFRRFRYISGLRLVSSEASSTIRHQINPNATSASHPKNSLAALATIIADATKVVEAYYENAASESSLTYQCSTLPSLDSTEPHPLDGQLSTLELRTAIETIEGACAQLSATVARPNHTMVNVSPTSP